MTLHAERTHVRGKRSWSENYGSPSSQGKRTVARKVDNRVRPATTIYLPGAGDVFQQFISVFGKVNRVMTGNDALDTLMFDADGTAYEHAAALTNYSGIFFNISMCEEMIRTAVHAEVGGRSRDIVIPPSWRDPGMRDALASMKGLNYHELSHILWSPRNETPFMQRIIPNQYGSDRSTFQAWNLIEDQRIDTLFTTRYRSSVPYYRHTISKFLIETAARQEVVYLYIAGRQFIPSEIRKHYRRLFANEFGAAVAQEARNLIMAYRKINHPTDDDQAVKLVEAFKALMQRLGILNEVNEFQPDQGHKADSEEGTQPDEQQPAPPSTPTDDIEDSEDDEEEEGNDGSGTNDGDDDDEEEEEEEGDGGADEGDDDSDEDADEGDGEGSGTESDDSDEDSNDGEGEGEGGEGEGETDDTDEGAEDGTTAGNSSGAGETESTLSDRAVEKMIQKVFDDSWEDIGSDIESVIDSLDASTGGQIQLVGSSGVCPTSEVDDAAIGIVRNITTELQRMNNDMESAWDAGSPVGRFNLTSYINRSDVADFDIWDQWVEGIEDETGADAIILLDQSTSMETGKLIGPASRAVWTMREAFKNLDISSAVWGFSNEGEVNELDGEGVEHNSYTYPIYPTIAGTHATKALQSATVALATSDKPNQILIIITDGVWHDQHAAREAIKEMNDNGVITSLFYLEDLSSPVVNVSGEVNSHGCRYAASIDDPMDMPPLVAKIVEGIVNNASMGR
jgi:hypothetical protein